MMMITRFTIYFCFFVCLFLNTFTEEIIQDDNSSLDSVIIDAAADIYGKRSTKQILFQNNYGVPPTFYNIIPQIPQISIIPGVSSHTPAEASPTSILATTGPCYNNKGELGKCVPFKQCYPYFKLPDVSNFDTWILSMYNTCSYYTSQGKQIFGVCCSNAILNSTTPNISSTSQYPPAIENIDNQNKEEPSKSPANNINENAKIPNWPPPIPTHPPDHTIPPLPTHPPSPGYPTTITSSTSTMKPSRKPPRPGIYPSKPIITTTSTTTRTTTKASHDIGTATNVACGAKNGFQDQGKIVGGHNSDPNEWPWIAALFINGRQFCGGSLIDGIHILTAAHCVAHMTSWDVAKLTVRLGDHDIKSNYEVRHLEKRVKRVVRHRGFDSRTLYNDIALLTLDSAVQFTTVIRPLCLPSSSVGARDWAGSTATVIGWGSIRESGPQPAVLQEVDIPIWSNRDCKLKYGHAAPGGIVDHMLCAGQANRDSCSGDSGGPLMVNHGKWTQVGVVSWGIGCGKGQYPGVYTRVQSFLPWITKNLKQ